MNKKFWVLLFFILVLCSFSIAKDEPDPTPVIKNWVIEEPDVKLEFLQNLETFKTKNALVQGITFKKNSVAVDSSSFPELNTPAKITFKNTGLSNPIVLKDGWWSPGTLVFNDGGSDFYILVDGFSEWALTETDWSSGLHNDTSVVGVNLTLAPDAVRIFDMDVNASTLFDNSTNAINADTTAPNATPLGNYGEGLVWDGVNDWVRTNVTIPEQNFSISFFIKSSVASQAANKIVFSDAISTMTNQNAIYLRLGGSDIVASWNNGSSGAETLVSIGNPISNTHFHHVLLTFDRNVSMNATLWVDSQFNNNKTITKIGSWDMKRDTWIGALTSQYWYFDGQIECLQIFPNVIQGAMGVQMVNNSETCNETILSEFGNAPIHTWKLDKYTKNQSDSSGDAHGDMGAFYVEDALRGSVFEFDGLDDYISWEENGTTTFNDDPGLAISAWVKSDHNTSSAVQFVIGKESLSKGWRMYSSNGLMYFLIGNGTSVATSFTTSRDWEHWVGSYNNRTQNISLYRNGVLVDSDIGSYLDDDADHTVAIGSENDLSNSFWNGSLDEITIFNRPLNQNEVNTLYSENVNLKYRQAGNWTSKIYNFSADYDNTIEVNVVQNVTLNNCSGVDLVGHRTGNCEGFDLVMGAPAIPDGSCSYTIESQGNCSQIIIHMTSDTVTPAQVANFTFNNYITRKPDVNNVSIWPGIAYANDTIWGNATFNLNDTDTMNVTFQFLVNSSPIREFYLPNVANGSTLTQDFASNFTKGDNVSFLVWANISSVFSEIMSSPNITILNSNFTVDSHSPFPSNLTVNVTEPNGQAFSVTLTDVDSDVITTWLLDDNTTGVTGLNYNFPGGYDTSGTYTIEANMSDGEYSQKVTWTLNVVDTPIEWEIPVALLIIGLMFFFLLLMKFMDRIELKLLFLFMALYLAIIAAGQAVAVNESAVSQNLMSQAYGVVVYGSYVAIALIIIFYIYKLLMYFGTIGGKK